MIIHAIACRVFTRELCYCISKSPNIVDVSFLPQGLHESLPLLQQALDEGIDPSVILNQGLIAAMDIVGEKFTRNEVFIPEMLISARTMAACTGVLKPVLAQQGSAEPLGKGVAFRGVVSCRVVSFAFSPVVRVPATLRQHALRRCRLCNSSR